MLLPLRDIGITLAADVAVELGERPLHLCDDLGFCRYFRLQERGRERRGFQSVSKHRQPGRGPQIDTITAMGLEAGASNRYGSTHLPCNPLLFGLIRNLLTLQHFRLAKQLIKHACLDVCLAQAETTHLLWQRNWLGSSCCGCDEYFSAMVALQ